MLQLVRTLPKASLRFLASRCCCQLVWLVDEGGLSRLLAACGCLRTCTKMLHPA